MTYCVDCVDVYKKQNLATLAWPAVRTALFVVSVRSTCTITTVLLYLLGKLHPSIPSARCMYGKQGAVGEQ